MVDFRERSNGKTISPLRQLILERNVVLKVSAFNGDEVGRVQKRLLQVVKCNSSGSEIEAWREAHNWLLKTQRNELCPVAIAMLDIAPDGDALRFSLDYLRNCTGSADTINQLIVNELVKAPLLSSKVFKYWKDSVISPPTSGQIRDLLNSPNIWMRMLASTAFPSCVAKTTKELITRDLVEAVAPHSSVEFLELIAQLDDDRFAIREKATRRLIARGNEFEAMIVNSKRDGLRSLEVESRLDRVLHEIECNEQCPPEYRVLDALSEMKTDEANRILELISNGPPGLRIAKRARVLCEDRCTKENEKKKGLHN